jgi:large subunit ribosomal protein L4
MPKLPVYNQDRKKVGDIELADAVFGAQVREHLLYAAVRYQRAKARSGTHSTKQRAEVSGGGRKPWKQKGTGRARQGSTRSPQWRGGGVVFGPRPRSHAFKLNKQVRRLALCSALSRRVAENQLFVVEDFQLAEMKTKLVGEFMAKFKLADMTLVLPAKDDRVAVAARNLKTVTVLPSVGLNVYDVLRHGSVVVTRQAVEALTQRLAGDTEVEAPAPPPPPPAKKKAAPRPKRTEA